MKVPLPVLFCSSLLIATSVVGQESKDSVHQHPIFGQTPLAENCDTYMAPSFAGWGAYAGRDFEEGEIVEMNPRYVPIKSEYLHVNVLDDYFYGFTYSLDPSDSSFGVVNFGKAMFYNHGAGDKQNVVYTSFGREPNKDIPWASLALVYRASRDIKRGEELLSSYGETNEWFTGRGLIMTEQTEQASPSLGAMQEREQQYCSKLVAGFGHSAWHHRIVPSHMAVHDEVPQFNYKSEVPLQDHASAIAKTSVSEGQVLEISPALVVPADAMDRSPLSPMVIYWDDMDDAQQRSIQVLREKGAYRMKGISEETGNRELDILTDYRESAILPAAGSIALVRKVGDDNPNCRIEIAASSESEEDVDYGSTGLVLKLIATKDIPAGEVLRLNMPDSSSWDSKMSLQQHLAITGQPIPKHLVEIYNPAVDEEEEEEEEEEQEF